MDNLGFDFRTLNFCILEGSQKVHERRQKVKVSLHSGDGKVKFVFISICVNPLFSTRTSSIK